MCKLILSTIFVIFVAITLSGCFGLIANIPGECKNETPFTHIHDFIPKVRKSAPKASTKEDFLKDWGKPDLIIYSSENVETWVYKRKLWCGVIPFLLLPVPLILPVCEGFDRIEFQGKVATRLHTRHIVASGFVGFYSGKDPVCQYPVYPKY